MTDEGFAPAGRSTIVVGVDGSDGARQALEWAVAEARLRTGRLTLVHALEFPHAGEAWVMPPSELTPIGEAAHALLDAAVVSARHDAPDLEVEGQLGQGSPAAALLDAAADAELVVVGSRGLGGLASRWLGSVSRQLTSHSPCPVVVIPPDGPSTARTGPPRVVVGVDDSPGSVLALRFAIAEARLREARLRVIHTWTFPSLSILPFAPEVPSPEVLDTEGQELIQRCLVDAGSPDDLTIEANVAQGHAADVLVTAAADADLLVVGARGAGGFGGLRLGSVADKCASSAPGPLIIVAEPVQP